VADVVQADRSEVGSLDAGTKQPGHPGWVEGPAGLVSEHVAAFVEPGDAKGQPLGLLGLLPSGQGVNGLGIQPNGPRPGLSLWLTLDHDTGGLHPVALDGEPV
jgi:hypothetical protein